MNIKNLKIENPILDLFRIRDISHILHLSTESYAEHMALNSFYDTWLDLSDQYIEIYQGKFSRIKVPHTSIISLDINNSGGLLREAKTLIDNLRAKHPSETGLNNVLDEFLNLIDKTKYLLTLK